MTLAILLAATGALAVALGLVSAPLRHLPLSEPLVALALGAVLGPAVTGVVELAPGQETPALELAAQVSLALSLMAVALRFPPDVLRAVSAPTAGLLLIALPVMAAVTSALAMWLLALPVAAAALLGASLAPTDPVLSANVVEGDPAERQLPERLRALLSLESGANDGVNALLVGLPMAVLLGSTTAASLAGDTVGLLGELLIALALGGLAGEATGRGLLWSEAHRDLERTAFLALTIALALGVLGLVELAGGEPLLGVLVAGLVYNWRVEQADRTEEWQVQEAINRYLTLPVMVLLGVGLPWDGWLALGWAGPALVVGTLVLRRLPIVLLLAPTLGLQGLREAVFLGWFGPIGVAALYYLAHAQGLGVVEETVWAAGTLVIASSIVAHGVTAAPGRRLVSGLAQRARAGRRGTP